MWKSPLLHFLVCLLVFGAAPLSAVTAQDLSDFPQLSAESDWPWWRGPSRKGVAASSAASPTKWDETKNVVWKTPVPGRGHSSPIVVGERVYLTTADEAAQIHSVLAFARKTGKLVWKVDVSRGGFPKQNHPKNTEATPTLACDGERLVATFFHDLTIEAIALDLEGKEAWRKTVGPFNPRKYEYGYAPSPLVYKNLVIIAAEWDRDSFLYALDRKNGKEVWRAARPNNTSFSSPVVAHVAGRDQLLISGADQVSSFDPSNGKPLWSVEGTSEATCGTVIWEGDVVFASGGYPKSDTLAVRADGTAEVLWRNRHKCYEQSMLVHAGHVYSLTDNGVMYCWRASDGKQMWSQRLKGPISASPVIAGGHIYWANELGTMYVIEPNPDKFTLVAENQLGNEAFASPAVAGSQLFLRVANTIAGKRQETLYCLGK